MNFNKLPLLDFEYAFYLSPLYLAVHPLNHLFVTPKFRSTLNRVCPLKNDLTHKCVKLLSSDFGYEIANSLADNKDKKEGSF
jgi:hypothetical protein